MYKMLNPQMIWLVIKGEMLHVLKKHYFYGWET